MFSKAVQIASQFTFPYVGLRRRRSGEVYSLMGAFVVVNSDGWALTSAHFVEELMAVQNGVQPAGSPADSACVEHVEVWATPDFQAHTPRLAEATVRPLSDLAAIHLDGFDGGAITQYPILRDVAERPVEQGMSVCRLGYPFHDMPAEWSTARQEFVFGDGAFPVPSFALDGIVARFRRMTADDGSGAGEFIETSTPGLRGQSGGPLLDVEGRVCGIQSHTAHMDLGFDARFVSDDQEVAIERQFLNVGAATHISDVVELLDTVGARYHLG